MQTLMTGPGYIDPKSNKVVFSYAHPIFWAPFSLVGDGGGGKPGVYFLTQKINYTARTGMHDLGGWGYDGFHD